jgi:hypothetical protein
MISRKDATDLVLLMDKRDLVKKRLTASRDLDTEGTIRFDLPIKGKPGMVTHYLPASFLVEEVMKHDRRLLATVDLRIAELNNKIKGGKA